MRILILGAGKMGTWLAESLCLDHEVGIYDPVKEKLRYIFNSQRFLEYEEFEKFRPELLINSVDLQHTIKVFNEVLPYMPEDCIISDIASVKNGLKDYYLNSKFRFVSTHPMFGPTFGNVKELRNQNAIIIKESDEVGKAFFRKFYNSFQINIFEYSFKKHDETIAYSLSIPFASSIIFGSCMKELEVPGTTFKKHLNISRGLLSEDNYLLSEILLNPYTINQIENIQQKLDILAKMIKKRNISGIHDFFSEIRENIGIK
ncbi:MAG: prephenate dehydrogenase/arogenate dehydrogenase family protein [Bacteroidales bacterium]|nr:prephenate dehydrogenase/arogenate dehydrogenase family protein [Bacteroidales bacterium]